MLLKNSIMKMFGTTDLDQFLRWLQFPASYLGRMNICPAASKCKVHILSSGTEPCHKIYATGTMLWKQSFFRMKESD